MTYYSPLRYPGGKRKLVSFVKDAISINGLQGGTYLEPFAGGASIALDLIINKVVDKVIINDIDRSIYSFWYCVLNHSHELCKKIDNVVLSIEEWEYQKDVQLNKESADYLDLAYSTFYLNRTNRSGIIKGGIIGGKNQSGPWKMDARFNKQDLINRIMRIASYADNISLYGLDAIDFVGKVLDGDCEKPFIFFDPPYYSKGSGLYVNHFQHEDHQALSNFIQGLGCNWMLSYDFTPQILEMYDQFEKRILSLGYSASKKIKGTEVLAFSQDFIIPSGSYSAINIS